jgi:hypothetical protein
VETKVDSVKDDTSAMRPMVEEIHPLIKSIRGKQTASPTNYIWGDQYNAACDQYANCTFIGTTDLPLTDAQRRQAFATYVNIVRTDNASVKLI